MVIINENVSFTDYAFGIRLVNSSKLATNLKNDNDITIYWYDVIFNFFCTSFVKFSYWFKFHISIITGSKVITIFLCKGWTGNPENGRNPIWVLPNICRLGLVIDKNFKQKTQLAQFTECFKNASVTAFTVSE